jgi:hypothetical protein
VTAIHLGREAKVDSFDVLGEDVCAGAETDGEQLGLQLTHALGERVGHHGCGRVRGNSIGCCSSPVSYGSEVAAPCSDCTGGASQVLIWSLFAEEPLHSRAA